MHTGCRSLLLWLAAVSILPAQPVGAETVQVPPAVLKSGFDYHMPYRGQTFMLPQGGIADRLTVYVSANIYRSFTFTVLLTEMQTLTGLHPGRILFESDPFTIPVSGHSDSIAYEADLGGIQLNAGRTYAFILDIYQFLSQADLPSLWQYTTLNGMGEGNAYGDGTYIYFTPDCTVPESGLPCGDRAAHFAGTWTAGTYEDMGFILAYTPRPPVLAPVLELLLKTE